MLPVAIRSAASVVISPGLFHAASVVTPGIAILPEKRCEIRNVISPGHLETLSNSPEFADRNNLRVSFGENDPMGRTAVRHRSRIQTNNQCLPELPARFRHKETLPRRA